MSQKFLRVASTKKTEALLEALEKDISKGNKVLNSPNAIYELTQCRCEIVKQIFSGGDLQQQVLDCLLCANVPQGE